MYLPRGVSEADGLTPAPRAPTYKRREENTFSTDNGSQYDTLVSGYASLSYIKRQFSSDPVQNTNITIGVAVGVLLGVFLIGLFAFLWVYRYSIRCSSRKKRRPSSRKSSKSSKSSKASSDHGGEPEAEAPPAAEATEETPADA